MLTQLSVRNFTLVESLDIDFDSGMSAITGETGAGKSILLNALGLTLGDRADYDQIRNGQSRAEVSAFFDVSQNRDAQSFLKEHDVDEEPNNECLLRRVINSSGTSKAWINGHPVTLSILRQLASKLISIHSQHEHQRLTKRDQQLQILDNYAGHLDLCAQVKDRYQEWHEAQQRLETLQQNEHQTLERLDLLRFQTNELQELNLLPDEYAALEKEQYQLANAESILKSLHQLGRIVSGDGDGDGEVSALQSLSHACQIADGIENPNADLSEALTLISNARIQIEESRDSIRRAQDATAIDPQRLEQVEARLSLIFDLARKHSVNPDELPDHLTKLETELNELESGDANLEVLSEKVTALESKYTEAATALNESRRNTAKQLSQNVNTYFDQLSMAGAELKIELADTTPSSLGGVETDFLVRTNPGQTHSPLARTASGGEISRISLAIQVVIAGTSTSSTLVFDEVDVGIGGATAGVVGDLLRKLSGDTQVICVTHLAQVASQAHSQFAVSKESSDEVTHTKIVQLERADRVKEIARMIGGTKMTEQSLAHAEDLLNPTSKAT